MENKQDKYVPTGIVLEATPPSKFKLTALQFALALITSMGMFSPGMALGFSAVALPQLRNETSFPELSEEQLSWFASVSNIATPVGCLLSAWTVDRWGRRASIIFLNVPGILGWIALAAADGLAVLYIGRILTGLAIGIASSAGSVYLGEVIQPRLRGVLLCWASIFISLGIMTVYICGSAMSWRWTAAAGVIPSVITVVASLFISESPSWLLQKGRYLQAERSILRIRGGGGSAVSTELNELANFHEKLAKQQHSVGLYQALKIPQFWKPLLIMNIFFAFQQFAGLYVVIFYAVDVVTEAGVNLDKYFATILIGVTRLVMTVVVSMLMRVCRRRHMSIVSGAGMSICMIALAAHIYFTAHMADESLSWVPAVSILLYIVMSSVGFMTLPWAMLGEVFPAQYRGLGGGLTTCCAYLLGFAVLKAYPGMIDTLMPAGVFLVYGVVSLLGTIFVAIWLPETAGRSLEQVEAKFVRKATLNEQDLLTDVKLLSSPYEIVDKHNGTRVIN